MVEKVTIKLYDFLKITDYKEQTIFGQYLFKDMFDCIYTIDGIGNIKATNKKDIVDVIIYNESNRLISKTKSNNNYMGLNTGDKELMFNIKFFLTRANIIKAFGIDKHLVDFIKNNDIKMYNYVVDNFVITESLFECLNICKEKGFDFKKLPRNEKTTKLNIVLRKIKSNNNFEYFMQELYFLNRSEGKKLIETTINLLEYTDFDSISISSLNNFSDTVFDNLNYFDGVDKHLYIDSFYDIIEYNNNVKTFFVEYDYQILLHFDKFDTDFIEKLSKLSRDDFNIMDKAFIKDKSLFSDIVFNYLNNTNIDLMYDLMKGFNILEQKIEKEFTFL